MSVGLCMWGCGEGWRLRGRDGFEEGAEVPG